MTLDNPYFVAILAIVVILFHLDLVADLLNLSALSPELPRAFRDTFDEERYQRAREYTGETTRFGILERSVFLAVFLVFWLGGGFGWLDGWSRGWGAGPVVTGLIAIGALFLAGQLLALPFEIYDTFVLEARYGFNRTSVPTFLLDRLKGLLLALILGTPLVAALLHVFNRFEHAWLVAWAVVSGVSLLLSYLAPRLILPLFNRFKPLEDGELKTAIHAMAERCRFPLREVSVMDGSKRSTKSNAFFTGFGRNKRIALFDTLIENHSTDELVAVLAHEIGHFKKRHILQQMVIGILHTGLLFFLLDLFLGNRALFAAFAVEEPSVHFGFIFFGLLFKPINRLLSVLMAVLSRRNEYQADAFAAEVTGRPESLVRALKRLAADNLANLTPHPFYVFMNYSHPPMIARIRALEA